MEAKSLTVMKEELFKRGINNISKVVLKKHRLQSFQREACAKRTVNHLLASEDSTELGNKRKAVMTDAACAHLVRA